MKFRTPRHRQILAAWALAQVSDEPAPRINEIHREGIQADQQEQRGRITRQDALKRQRKQRRKFKQQALAA